MIHLLYEVAFNDEEPGPVRVMSTTDAALVPAMLEAWLETNGRGWKDVMRDMARRELEERLRLGRPGRIMNHWGGLTYDRVPLFQGADKAASAPKSKTQVEALERKALGALDTLKMLVEFGGDGPMGRGELKAARRAADDAVGAWLDAKEGR